MSEGKVKITAESFRGLTQTLNAMRDIRDSLRQALKSSSTALRAEYCLPPDGTPEIKNWQRLPIDTDELRHLIGEQLARTTASIKDLEARLEDAEIWITP